MAVRKVSIEEEKKALKMYKSGMTVKEVAEQLGFHPATLRIAFVRSGVVLRRRGGQKRREVSADVVAQMVEMYQCGATQREIGERFGIKTPLIVSRTLAAAGIQMRKAACGEKHPNWKGGKIRSQRGYVWVQLEKNDPLLRMASPTRYVLEHRVVMARKLGRLLTRHETVHHINGNPADNRPENLQLRQGNHGPGHQLQCADCGSHNIKAIELN